MFSAEGVQPAEQRQKPAVATCSLGTVSVCLKAEEEQWVNLCRNGQLQDLQDS